MHAVFITFQSSANLDDLAEPFTAYAHSLESVRGLAFKTWLRDGAMLGGFHVFADRNAADAYLGGAMVAGMMANAAFSGFEVRHFAVLEELSRISGTPHLATR